MSAGREARMDARMIAGRLSETQFHFRRYLLASNVSHGMLPWEADLIAMSPSGYLSEIEIKISIADLKRDPLKRKWSTTFWRTHEMFKALWFAMPESVWAHKDAAACVPEHAGVIVLSQPLNEWNLGVKVVRPATENRNARALPLEAQFQLARLAAMRHWAKLAREARKEAGEISKRSKAA